MINSRLISLFIITLTTLSSPTHAFKHNVSASAPRITFYNKRKITDESALKAELQK